MNPLGLHDTSQEGSFVEGASVDLGRVGEGADNKGGHDLRTLIVIGMLAATGTLVTFATPANAADILTSGQCWGIDDHGTSHCEGAFLTTGGGGGCIGSSYYNDSAATWCDGVPTTPLP